MGNWVISKYYCNFVLSKVYKFRYNSHVEVKVKRSFKGKVTFLALDVGIVLYANMCVYTQSVNMCMCKYIFLPVCVCHCNSHLSLCSCEQSYIIKTPRGEEQKEGETLQKSLREEAHSPAGSHATSYLK